MGEREDATKMALVRSGDVPLDGDCFSEFYEKLV